ncbi:MAG: hypothetical protein M3R24_31955 [Chloroflexota bacterium]|nr:hypothetical protein [Chloroflexota bacterium]
MDRPRYAQHHIDGYRFYLDLEHDELTIEFSHYHPTRDYPERPPLTINVMDTRALDAFLSLPDVAAVLLTDAFEYQHAWKRFHDDPANQ